MAKEPNLPTDFDEERAYKKGQAILYKNSPVDYVYYISDGHVKVHNLDVENEEQFIHILKAGQFFPLFLLSTDRLHFFYSALDNAKVRKMSAQRFLKVMEKDENLARQMLSFYAMVTQRLLKQAEITRSGTAEYKIMSLLLWLADNFGKKEDDYYVFDFQLTHKDISRMVGLSRETTSVHLKNLEKINVINKQTSRKLVLKKSLLERLLRSKSAR